MGMKKEGRVKDDIAVSVEPLTRAGKAAGHGVRTADKMKVRTVVPPQRSIPLGE